MWLLVSGGGEQVIASRGSCAAHAVGDHCGHALSLGDRGSSGCWELRNSGEGEGVLNMVSGVMTHVMKSVRVSTRVAEIGLVMTL